VDQVATCSIQSARATALSMRGVPAAFDLSTHYNSRRSGERRASPSLLYHGRPIHCSRVNSTAFVMSQMKRASICRANASLSLPHAGPVRKDGIIASAPLPPSLSLFVLSDLITLVQQRGKRGTILLSQDFWQQARITSCPQIAHGKALT
jgi:hypothetical protein